MGVAVHREGPVRGNGGGVNKTWWHRKWFRISERFNYIKPQSSEYGMIWWHDVIPLSSVHRHTAATHKIQQAAAETCVKQRHNWNIRLSDFRFTVLKMWSMWSCHNSARIQDTDTEVMLGKVSDRPVQPTPAELNTWEDVRGVAYSESHRGLQCCVSWRAHSKCVNWETCSDGKTIWLAGNTFWRLFCGFHVVW
jgi:hypothetical protein